MERSISNERWSSQHFAETTAFRRTDLSSFLPVELSASLLDHIYLVFSFGGGLIAALANQAVPDCSPLIFDFESCCFYFRPEEGAVCLKGFSGICILISLTVGSATCSLALPTSLDHSACGRMLVGLSWCHFSVQQCHRVRLWRGKGIPSIHSDCHWSESLHTGFKSHGTWHALFASFWTKSKTLPLAVSIGDTLLPFLFLLSPVFIGEAIFRLLYFLKDKMFQMGKKKRCSALFPYVLQILVIHFSSRCCGFFP